jgi:hypothetical protein
MLEGFPNDRPCRGPALAEVLTHGERMFSAADRPIAVVVDLYMCGTPYERDGEVGGQAETDCCAETLRPRFNGTERRLAPVPRTYDLAHLPATDEPIFWARMYADTLTSQCGIRHGRLLFLWSARGRQVLVERHDDESETATTGAIESERRTARRLGGTPTPHAPGKPHTTRIGPNVSGR